MIFRNIFLSIFWIPCAALSAFAQEAPSRAELEALNDAIAGVQARIEAARGERGAVEILLEQAEQALSETGRRIRAIENRIAGEEARLRRLEERSAGLRAAMTEQQALITQYLRGAWLSGRQEYLKLLLNQEDVSASARTLRYYRYFNEARTRRIAEWNATLEELALLEEEARAATLVLRDSRAELEARRADLEAAQAGRRTLLDDLDRALADSGGELERLQRERGELEALIEELERSITGLAPDGGQQPFAELKGRLPWPVEGELLNSFGARHALGDLDWQGVTMAAETGSDVRAIHHGRVVYADWFANSGLLLIIDHGDGYMSLYAHNQMLYREVGDWVAGGDAVAAAGNTGGRRESGVYFEIRVNGRSQDPAAWCVARN